MRRAVEIRESCHAWPAAIRCVAALIGMAFVCSGAPALAANGASPTKFWVENGPRAHRERSRAHRSFRGVTLEDYTVALRCRPPPPVSYLIY
jgi:hypothetical protein